MVKRVLFFVTVSLLIGFAILNIFDLIEIFKNPKEYPFGSEFFSPLSIYSSKSIYVLYSVVSIILSLFTLFAGYKKKWGLFFFLLFIDTSLIIYPMLTNSESLFFLKE